MLNASVDTTVSTAGANDATLTPRHQLLAGPYLFGRSGGLMLSKYELSTRPRYPSTRNGLRQLNVLLNEQISDEPIELKQRSGDTRLVGSWYRDLMAELIKRELAELS